METKKFDADFKRWLDDLSSKTSSGVPIVRQSLSHLANQADESLLEGQLLDDDEAVQVAKKEILEKIEDHRPKIPRGLEKSWKWEGRMAGLATGSLAGFKLGAGFGIATAGWGMAATIPGAIIGGVIGVLVGDKVGGGMEKPSRGFIPDVPRLSGDENPSVIQKRNVPQLK